MRGHVKYITREEIKITKRKPLKIASPWLIPGLALSLLVLALPMAGPVEAG
jgi:hypothetical protein